MTANKSILAIVDPNSLNVKRIESIANDLLVYETQGSQVSVFMLSEAEKYYKLACDLADKVSCNSSIKITHKTAFSQDRLLTFAQLGLYIGDLLNNIDSQEFLAFIYSTKASFLKLAESIKMMGFESIARDLKNDKIIMPSLANADDHSYPAWYNSEYTITAEDIGLLCEKVPCENNLKKPQFIPFDRKSSRVRIGSASDISLGLWDTAKGLYPSHVEIEYKTLPESKWYIRSLHGVRRGCKSVLVNNNMISAASSSVNISDGDEITLGGFSFIFKTSRLEELIRYEKPESLMVGIETLIKLHVEKYSADRVPIGLLEEITIQENGNGGSVWTHAYLRHYGIFLQHNWEHELSQSFRDVFKNVIKFKHDMIKLNGIRNQIMHPKHDISIKDKKFLSRIYVNILKCTTLQSPQ